MSMDYGYDNPVGQPYSSKKKKKSEEKKEEPKTPEYQTQLEVTQKMKQHAY